MSDATTLPLPALTPNVSSSSIAEQARRAVPVVAAALTDDAQLRAQVAVQLAQAQARFVDEQQHGAPPPALTPNAPVVAMPLPALSTLAPLPPALPTATMASSLSSSSFSSVGGEQSSEVALILSDAGLEKLVVSLSLVGSGRQSR